MVEDIAMRTTVTVSVSDFAITYDCTTKHVYEMLRVKRIAGAQKVDGEWQIPRATLKKMLEIKAARRNGK